jgi:hypothetical protein
MRFNEGCGGFLNRLMITVYMGKEALLKNQGGLK